MAAKNRLPRSLTLKSRADVSRLLKQGKRIHGRLCTLVWEKSESFRYGIFLSGKIGPAHDRNRIKRQIREAIRLCRDDLAMVVAVLPRAESAKSTGGEIRADVNQLLDRVRNER